MPVGATVTGVSFLLPPPVVANDGGRTPIGRSAAPPLIGLISGLVAVSSSQPRAELLFIGAGTVILGCYFVVPPTRDDEETYSITSAFLQRMPDVFTACGCILIVLGIGNAFPHQIVLIPLFSFIAFAALPAVFGMTLAAWIAAALYGAALVSLVVFVVLTFVA